MERPEGYQFTIEFVSYSDGDWMLGSRKWSATFTDPEGKTLSATYNTGPAIGGVPTFEDVMNAIVSDASFYEQNPTRGEFARESGFDYEDPELDRSFKACKSISENLRDFLGDDYEAMAEYVA